MYLRRTTLNQIIMQAFPDLKDPVLVEPILFGNFKGAATPGDEEIRIYEDLHDYDSLKPIFEGNTKP